MTILGGVEQVVRLERRGRVGLIITDNPPINALGHAVRQGLLTALTEAAAEPDLTALVVACAGRTFFAGADISEFGKPIEPPLLPEVYAAIAGSGKPVVAAIHGTALGGGLEVALACHYRLCAETARMGLPEVNLGIIPGAGGTQRLPRLIGVEKALELITSGAPVDAATAAELGLVDEVVAGDLLDSAVRFAAEAAASGGPHVLVSDREEAVAAFRDRPEFFREARARAAAANPGKIAPTYAVDALEAAATLPFDEGIERETALMTELLGSPQSKAQQYFFFAERAAAKVPGLSRETPVLEVSNAAVIGAGTMGSGITTALANAGISVVLVEQGQEQLDRGIAAVRSNWQRQVDRSRMTAEQLEEKIALVTPTLDLAAIARADLVIEAVFEQMAVKKETFVRIDAHARPGSILGTNTSSLDIDEIAAATGRPRDVIGLHFFSPAHVMRLLEVVRGAKTSDTAIATAMALGKRIGKVPVLVGVCDGFVGNRMLFARERQSNALLLEGALPQQIDAAAKALGFPMGSFEMQDMAGGIDVLYRLRQEQGTSEPIGDRLAELGRYGQKTGAGYYRYEPGNRTPIPDPVVEVLIREASRNAGVERREISEEEIVERLVYSLINEGAKILDEGVALRGSDIDVIFVYGYGWPVHKGGPMYEADRIGAAGVLEVLRSLEARHGQAFTPSRLVERLAAEGGRFTDVVQGA